MSNLLANRPDLNERKIENVPRLMDAAVLDCLVTDYEPLIPSLVLPDPKDRHVLAAAIKGHASAIVTFNLDHFPPATLHPYGIHAKHPDEFFLDLFSLDEDSCMDAIQADLEHYKSPALSLDTYLDSLVKAGAPKTAAFLHERKIIFE